MGKFLIITGIILVVIGLAVEFRVPFLGKLPGDFRWENGRTTIHFPLMSCIVISIVVSLVLYFLNRGRS